MTRAGQLRSGDIFAGVPARIYLPIYLQIDDSLPNWMVSCVCKRRNRAPANSARGQAIDSRKGDIYHGKQPGRSTGSEHNASR